MATSLETQWKRIQRNIYNAAYRGSYQSMENQTRRICMMFSDIVSGDSSYTAMTGNSATGLAVGLYKNGELLAYSTMMEAGQKSPITHVLTKEDVFRKGDMRYDGTAQKYDFSVQNSGANTPYLAWRRAVNKLRRTKPSYKGYSFVIAHGAHYLKYSGYDHAVTTLYAELRNVGAKLIAVKLRNT